MSETESQVFPGPGEVPIDATGVKNILKVNLPDDLPIGENFLAADNGVLPEIGDSWNRTTVIATQKIEGTQEVAVMPDSVNVRRHTEVSPYARLLRDQEVAAQQQRVQRDQETAAQQERVRQARAQAAVTSASLGSAESATTESSGKEAEPPKDVFAELHAYRPKPGTTVALDMESGRKMPRWVERDPWVAKGSEGLSVAQISRAEMAGQVFFDACGYGPDGSMTGTYEPTPDAPEGTAVWHVRRYGYDYKTKVPEPYTDVLVGDEAAGNGYRIVPDPEQFCIIRRMAGGQVTSEALGDDEVNSLFDTATYDLEQTDGFRVYRPESS